MTHGIGVAAEGAESVIVHEAARGGGSPEALGHAAGELGGARCRAVEPRPEASEAIAVVDILRRQRPHHRARSARRDRPPGE